MLARLCINTHTNICTNYCQFSIHWCSMIHDAYYNVSTPTSCGVASKGMALSGQLYLHWQREQTCQLYLHWQLYLRPNCTYIGKEQTSQEALRTLQPPDHLEAHPSSKQLTQEYGWYLALGYLDDACFHVCTGSRQAFWTGKSSLSKKTADSLAACAAS